MKWASRHIISIPYPAPISTPLHRGKKNFKIVKIISIHKKISYATQLPQKNVVRKFKLKQLLIIIIGIWGRTNSTVNLRPYLSLTRPQTQTYTKSIISQLRHQYSRRCGWLRDRAAVGLEPTTQHSTLRGTVGATRP